MPEDGDATAELLAALDELYPLPDDDQMAERAGRTAAVVKRWMRRTTAEIETKIPSLIAKYMGDSSTPVPEGEK